MKVTAKRRTKVGTSASRQARARKLIPTVIYGKGIEPVPVLIDLKEMQEIVKHQGRNAIFDVEIESAGTHQVIIKNVQRAALKNEVSDMELQVIEKGQKLQLQVPIVLEGEETVKIGVLSQTLAELSIETTPDNIPAELVVNVAGMEIGDKKTVADLAVPAGITVLDDAGEDVAVVTPPSTEEAGETPETEVIGGEAE